MYPNPAENAVEIVIQRSHRGLAYRWDRDLIAEVGPHKPGLFFHLSYLVPVKAEAQVNISSFGYSSLKEAAKERMKKYIEFWFKEHGFLQPIFRELR